MFGRKKPTARLYFKIIFGLRLQVRIGELIFGSYEDLTKHVFTQIPKKQVYAYFSKISKRINPEQYNGLESGEYSLAYDRFAGLLEFAKMELTLLRND
jgi:hypothetical protein